MKLIHIILTHLSDEGGDESTNLIWCDNQGNKGQLPVRINLLLFEGLALLIIPCMY